MGFCCQNNVFVFDILVHDDFRSLLQMSCHAMSQRCSIQFRADDWEGHWSTLDFMFMEPVWDETYIMSIRRWVNCGHNMRYMIDTNNRMGCVIQIFAKKTFPTPLYHHHHYHHQHHQQPELLTQSRLGLWSHGTNFWPYHWNILLRFGDFIVT